MNFIQFHEYAPDLLPTNKLTTFYKEGVSQGVFLGNLYTK